MEHMNLHIEIPRLSDEQAAVFQQFFYAFIDSFDTQYCHAIERHYQTVSEPKNYNFPFIDELISTEEPF